MSKTERSGLTKKPQNPSNEMKIERPGQNVGEIEKTTKKTPRTQQKLEGRDGQAAEISGFDTLWDITRGLV